VDRHVRRNFFRGGGEIDGFGWASVIEKRLFQSCGNDLTCTPFMYFNLWRRGIDPPNPSLRTSLPVKGGTLIDGRKVDLS
jgi:hypothetical protein